MFPIDLNSVVRMITLQAIKVLVADDEDSFRLGLEMSLKMSEEFAVQTCDTPEGAIGLLKEQTFDVAIFDYQMPGMTGLELVDWMRTHKIETPVIMLTGHGSESLAAEAIKHGVHEYFRKDQINIRSFSTIIKKVHEQHLHQQGKQMQEKAELLWKAQLKEKETLNAFQRSIGEVGEFVESSIAIHLKNLRRAEQAIREMVDERQREECTKLFGDLKEEIENLKHGMQTILTLSSVLTEKRDSQNKEKPVVG